MILKIFLKLRLMEDNTTKMMTIQIDISNLEVDEAYFKLRAENKGKTKTTFNLVSEFFGE